MFGWLFLCFNKRPCQSIFYCWEAKEEDLANDHGHDPHTPFCCSQRKNKFLTNMAPFLKENNWILPRISQKNNLQNKKYFCTAGKTKQSNRKGQRGFETDCGENKSIRTQCCWLWRKMSIKLFGRTNKYLKQHFDWMSSKPQFLKLPSAWSPHSLKPHSDLYF